MKQVHVLCDRGYSRNTEAFLFPLHYNRKRLQDRGVTLRFFQKDASNLFDCDVLCVNSKFFKTWWDGSDGERIFSFLSRAKEKVELLLWFDTSDSTGTTHFSVLPYVDRYVKNQALRDRRAYQKKYYGSRITTDFYHRVFGIEDADPGPPHLNYVPSDEDIKKICVGWNYGMAHYGYYGELFGKVRHQVKWFPRWYPKRWYAPSVKRPVSLSCRIGTTYRRATVAFPRKEIQQRLNGRIPVNRISRQEFFSELCQSIASISPFGFGEICYRDFEIVLAGAAMIKQDVSHLETWPNLWIANETYLPFAWDFSDFEEKLEYVLQCLEDTVELARNAQERYRMVVCANEGYEEFCQRFANILDPNLSV